MPFRQFNQSELTASLGPGAQGGVCKVLVMEWLAAGGDLDRAMRNLRMVSRRRGDDRVQSVSAAVGKRIEDAQANTMPWDLVREYGLVRAGGNDLGGGTVQQLIAYVTGHVGYYYIAVNPPVGQPGAGHALGAVTTSLNNGRVFDPNEGELSPGGLTPNFFPGAVGQFATHYAQAGLTHQIAMRVLPPTFIGR